MEHPPACILIVEDSPTQAERLRLILESQGFAAVVARDAEAALEAMAANQPDVVVSDIVMPGLSGYELCRRIKAESRWRDVPVILLTTLKDPMDIIQGLECGADNFFTKPYQPERLIERIRRILENKQLRAQGKLRMGVEISFLGKTFTISSDREQILDLLISTFEDIVRTNEELETSRRDLETANAKVEAYARQMEGEARVSEEKYQTLMENVGDGIICIDDKGRIESFNPAAQRMFGHSAADAIGMDANALAADPERDGPRTLIARYLETGMARYVGRGAKEIEGRRKDGSTFPLEVVVSEVSFAGRRLFIASARDLTERRQAEQAVRKLTTAIEQSDSLVVVTDRDGAIEYVNRKFVERTGFGRDEVVGRNPRLWQSGLEPIEKYQDLWRTILAGNDWHGEFQNRAKDGTPYQVRATISPVRSPAGEITHFIAVEEDVTEIRRAEEALRASEARFRSVVDNSPSAIFLKDPDGRYLLVNREYEKWFNVSQAEIVGKTAREIYPEEIAERFLSSDRRSIETRSVYSNEHEAVYPDGKRRTVLAVRFPIFGPDGGIAAIGGTSFDITGRRRAEEALREREARERALMDNAPAQICIRDRAGRYVLANKEFERRHGLQPGDAVGKTPHDLFPKETADAFLADDQEILKAGVPVMREKEVAYRSGERLTVLSTKFPVPGPDGHPIGVGAFSTDITDRVKIQEQLRQSQKMDAVGQLTGGVAHDFNNLLTVVLGNLELVEATADTNPRIHRHLEIATRAARRGAELTKRLLAFSRKQVLEPEICSMNNVVAGMSELLRRTLGETIEIETVLGGGLWSTRVDVGQMENALLNLAINARDAMPRGGKLTVETANVRLDENYADHHADLKPGQYVMIAVSDTGSGIPAHLVERVFEPFFTTKETGKGTGLGLSMVYGFVKQSGGHVMIYSEQGHGTTIKMYLPRIPDAAAQDKGRASGQPEAVAAATVTILLVEDDPDVREIGIAMLEDLGYRVVAADNGRAALDVLRGHDEIGLMFTDMVMPGGIGGADLAREARALRPGLKVLYCSGYTENSVLHNGVLDSGDLLLGKPYSRQDLARKVQRALKE